MLRKTATTIPNMVSIFFSILGYILRPRLRLVNGTLLTLLLFALPSLAQNTRYDFQATTTTGVGNLVPVLAIPGASISFYTGCTTLPCSTPAVTYQSISSGTACPSNAQVVWQLPLTQTCTSTADSQGDFGGYFQTGNYQFTETVSGHTYGPYEFSVGGGGGGNTFSNLIVSARPWADVRAYGAQCNGTFDDTSAINSAITAMHFATANCGLGSTAPTANCTGVVEIPNLFCYASQIVMQSNVTLQGTGWNNSGLVQRANSNEHFIVGTNPVTDQRFTVQDLYINGNASNQTGSFNCIDFNGTGALGSSTRSPRHTLMNLFVSNCLQDGVDVYGDAGSDYIFNLHSMNNGRYGLLLNVFDSQVLFSEFGSNGTAGFVTGANGNGAISHVKSWGNGAGSTTGVGYIIDAPNYRVENNEAQDNGCYGFQFDNTKDIVATGLFSDGNGFSGGGHGCSGFLINGLSNSKIQAIVRGVTDAGKSDFALSFTGTQTQNDIDVNWSLLAGSGFYTGSIAGNNIVAQGGNYTSLTWNNGIIVSGFTDLTQTKTLSIDNSQGNFNGNVFQSSANGIKVYSLGGPNNWNDFSTDTSVLGLIYSGGSYRFLEGASGTGTTGQPLQFGMPVQLSTVATGNCLTTTTLEQVIDTGSPCNVVPSTTVSALPSASTPGKIIRVSDATTVPAATCTGGGSLTALAVSNGSAWSCH